MPLPQATSMREPGRDAGTGEAGGAPDAAPTSMVKAVNKGGLTAAQKMMQKCVGDGARKPCMQ